MSTANFGPDPSHPYSAAEVQSQQASQLVAQATELEARGELQAARQCWLMAVQLMPRESSQAAWIIKHVQELENVPGTTSKWAKRLAPFGPLAVLLAKGKTLLAILFKLKFLLSFAAFIGIYWAAWGAKFGIGFALLILIHEMGHFIDVKRRGLPAEMPVFLPGFGAYVRWNAMGVSLVTRAEVSLAGPLAGLLSSALCGVLAWTTHDRVWAALAHTGAWLNALNLIPVWVLDGRTAILAMARSERALLIPISIGLWAATGDLVFIGVALAVLWRLFSKDLPSESSPLVTAYFIAVLTALGGLLWLFHAPTGIAVAR